LANLECDRVNICIDRVNKYLEAACAIYQKSGLIWGIVNSEIVRCRALMKDKSITDEYLTKLSNTRNIASSVEYAYETHILEDLLQGKNVDDYRLLFL